MLATRQETLEAYGYALKMSRFRIGFLHVRCDLKAEFNPPRKRAIFLVTETAGFDEVASMRHAFERLDIADGADRFAETLKPVPWSDYALAKITEIIERDGGYSARVSTMVRSLQGDPPVFTALLRYLGSVAQTAGKKRGKRAWTSTAERRERRLGSRRSARFNLRSKAGGCERPENAKSGWPSLTDSGLNRV